MTRSALRRTAATFLLLLLALAALAGAAPRRPAASPKAGPSKSRNVVATFWSTLMHIWEKAGSSLDPDGLQQPNPRPNGSSLDPNGLQADNGGSLDPDGAK
ncbi:MAG TPA: hypothetical protein VF173_03345 [Thermoanaerobaculia bacterium]|nr:hypothetical protein [Thermoanaerobaculia bacterium]